MGDLEGDKPELQAAPPAAKRGRPGVEHEADGKEGEPRLSPRETRFVDALAAGETSCQAAKVASVSDRTGRRWRLRPEIQAAVRSRLNDSLASARAILAQGSARAARSLVDMSDGESDATSPKVAASRAVIDQATALASIEDLQAEVEAIKQQLADLPS
jgi:phage terminase small subunit